LTVAAQILAVKAFVAIFLTASFLDDWTDGGGEGSKLSSLGSAAEGALARLRESRRSI
jgi:hypothetical protein